MEKADLIPDNSTVKVSIPNNKKTFGTFAGVFTPTTLTIDAKLPARRISRHEEIAPLPCLKSNPIFANIQKLIVAQAMLKSGANKYSVVKPVSP